MRGRIKLDRLSRLEEITTDLYAGISKAAVALNQYEADLKAKGLANASEVERALIESKSDIGDILRSVPSVTSLLILAPVVDALKKANDLVLADHATLLGREGCEKRWDRAMADLKKALNRFDFDESTQQEEH
jgi:DNA-binding FrmR family transcriptional regulator